MAESKETRIRRHCKTLRLPSVAAALSETLSLAQQETWSLEDSLLYLLEAEIEGRQERRIARLMRQAHLPPDKTLDAFDQSRLTPRLRQMIPRLRDGDFINRAENVLVFGLPGTGKTHFTAALAGEWIQNNHSALFTPAYKLIDGLLRAKRDHELARELRRLDRFEVVILDDIGYIQQSREEMEVLFTFFAERYERRSIVITSNLVFSAWDKIFKDPLTTAAAIDRVVHHSHIVEFGPEITSMRAEEAQRRQRSTQQ
jgi:DNA replication protein DnaC